MVAVEEGIVLYHVTRDGNLTGRWAMSGGNMSGSRQDKWRQTSVDTTLLSVRTDDNDDDDDDDGDDADACVDSR